MLRLGMILNQEKRVGMPAALALYDVLTRLGAHVQVNAVIGEALSERGETAEPLPDKLVVQNCDMLIVLGGDGSILRCASLAAPANVPIWGIHLGRMGFLAETMPGDMLTSLPRILEGQYALEERMMLSTIVNGVKYTALNEFVVSRPVEQPMLRTDVFVGEQHLDHFVSDGLLVASPTGSTAYWLSCGGSVVAPTVQCLLLTAICPHSLRSRPVVLPPDETVRAALGEQKAMLVRDGDVIAEVTGDIEIRRAEHRVCFVRLEKRNFYALLQKKMAEW